MGTLMRAPTAGEQQWQSPLDNPVDDVEITCLKSLRHKHLVNLFEIYETRSRLWLVMEIVAGGELHDYIVSKTDYNERFAASCMRQCMLAIHYMHSHGVIHRDLKPQNILLTEKSDSAVVKLADFGLCRLLTASP